MIKENLRSGTLEVIHEVIHGMSHLEELDCLGWQMFH